VAAPPRLDELLTVPRDRLGLVQALQRAVHELVYAPATRHRNPHPIELLEHDPERLDRALEHRRVRQIEREPLVLEQAPGGLRLFHPELAQRHVHPPREAIIEIPLALPVAQKNELGPPADVI